MIVQYKHDSPDKKIVAVESGTTSFNVKLPSISRSSNPARISRENVRIRTRLRDLDQDPPNYGQKTVIKED